MATTTTLVELGDEIHLEIGSPSDLTAASIVVWLQSNIGLLNDVINVGYDIVSGLAVPALDIVDKVIFKKLYFIHYYDRKLRATLNLATSDSVIEITEGGATVRRLNKTEQAKVYKELKNTENEELKLLTANYRMNNSVPLSVDGKDTIEGYYSPTYTTTDPRPRLPQG